MACCGNIAMDLREAMGTLDAQDVASIDEWMGGLDRTFGQYFRRIEACRRYLELHRPANTDHFSFGEAFHRWNPSSGGVVLGFDGAGKLPLVGDSRQMLLCLELIALNACFDTARDFEIRVHAASDPPNLLIRLGEEARLGTTVQIGPDLTVSRDRLATCWAGATGGGQLHDTPDGLVMELHGDGTTVRGVTGGTEAEALLRKAERAMMPWRGAIGHTETGYVAASEVASLYRSHLTRAAGYLEEAMNGLSNGTDR